MFKPTPAQIEAARDKAIPDVIASDLRVLFCGINPSLYSAAIGHHFGRPGNRFWPVLHQAGITDHQLSPFDDRQLLQHGIGITNIVERATARADEIADNEFIEGVKKLERKIATIHPCWLAVLGVTAYRVGFGQRKAVIGEQATRIDDTRLWVLPNPSGLNAHYQLGDLVRVYSDFFEVVGRC